MWQAIEEGFILDVLQNYTTYDTLFKLAKASDESDKEFERAKAAAAIARFVHLHPYAIAQKVEVVVEHFRQYIAPLLNGHAKAMVVVGSRQEVVRWKIAIDKYIKERGYGIGTLVAGLNRAVQLGGTLTLVCSHDRILKLFRITGLDAVFTIHATVDDALGTPRSSSPPEMK